MSKAVNPGASAKRILVIKLSALGDFVLAMGAMRVIREFHPDAHITLLTTLPYQDFARASGLFDRIQTNGRPETGKETRALLKSLRKEQYEVVYDLHTSGRTRNYFRALNFGFGPKPLWSGHAKGSAFFHSNPAREGMHSIDRLADQLEVAGIPRDIEPTWPPMPDLSFVREKFGDRANHQLSRFGLKGAYGLLVPGTSAHRDAKRWPHERYADLAGMIADAGIQPVIIGGKAETALAAKLAVVEPRIKNLTGQTDLFQIVTLAQSAAFVVGNDTGPMHMATLAGCPGVALFATDESDPAKAAPRGGQVIICKAPVLDQISVEDVWQAVRMVSGLSERKPA